jgi:hypothetical protein
MLVPPAAQSEDAWLDNAGFIRTVFICLNLSLKKHSHVCSMIVPWLFHIIICKKTTKKQSVEAAQADCFDKTARFVGRRHGGVSAAHAGLGRRVHAARFEHPDPLGT